MTKITVFEVPGTSVQNSITGQTNYVTPEEIAKGAFYQGLDPDVFNYVFVQGHSNVIKPMGPSITKGVQILTDYINDRTVTPSKYAIIGTSQGALIGSQVVKKLMSGEINRLSDCLGAFFIGNPAREQGRAFPGATSTPGGHGVATSAYRLTNTPSWVWEFANPGDPVCTNDTNTLIGQLREQSFTNLLTSWDGNFDSLSDVFDIAKDIVDMFTFGVGTGIDMGFYHVDSAYAQLKPIAGDNRNLYQITIDYLNKVAGPSYRADGWSTTLKYPTS